MAHLVHVMAIYSGIIKMKWSWTAAVCSWQKRTETSACKRIINTTVKINVMRTSGSANHPASIFSTCLSTYFLLFCSGSRGAGACPDVTGVEAGNTMNKEPTQTTTFTLTVTPLVSISSTLYAFGLREETHRGNQQRQLLTERMCSVDSIPGPSCDRANHWANCLLISKHVCWKLR